MTESRGPAGVRTMARDKRTATRKNLLGGFATNRTPARGGPGQEGSRREAHSTVEAMSTIRGASCR